MARVICRVHLGTGFSSLGFSVESLCSSAILERRLHRPSPCLIRSVPGRKRVRGLREASEKWPRYGLFGDALGDFFGV